jgi:YVTN family beta-propeller protein
VRAPRLARIHMGAKMTRSVSRGFGVLVFISVLSAAAPLAAQVGYVTNSASGGFVSFIDGGTNSILTGPVLDVLVGHQPTYLVLSPDNTRLYVSNLTCNYPDVIQGCVSVIRTDALATSPTLNIPVGDFPRGLAITPDGARLYVVNGFETMSVIDTSTSTVVATISNIPANGEIVMSPDGTRAYVPGYFNGQGVTVIDTAANAVVGHLVGLPSGDPIYGIAITPDGSRLYVANGNLVDIDGNYVGSNTVAVIDIATNTRLTTISVAPQPTDVAVTPDGSKVYVAGLDPHGTYGTLTVIDTATNTVLTAVTTDCCLAVPTITPDGSKVFVTNQRFGAYGVEVFSTVTNTLITTITNTTLFPTQFYFPYAIVFAHPQTPTATPTQMVSDLITAVVNTTSGLNTGQANSLTAKLNNALLAIQQGRNGPAINQLNAFINAVQADARSGKISAATATSLVDAANAVIAALSTAVS